MCYDEAAPEARSNGTPLELTAADGTVCPAYLAKADKPNGRSMIMLPDVNGLRPVATELAHRFAESGTDALVIDYYGRTAGTAARPEDFPARQHAMHVRRENIVLDAQAALAFLRSIGSGPTFVTGFCVGGANALYLGASGMDLAGVIAFCPWTGEFGHSPALPIEYFRAVRSPVLGLFGGADSAVPNEIPNGLERELTDVGLPHQVVIYPNQPHGFFERNHFGEPGHASAAADAWAKVMAFVNAEAPAAAVTP